MCVKTRESSACGGNAMYTYSLAGRASCYNLAGKAHCYNLAGRVSELLEFGGKSVKGKAILESDGIGELGIG